MYGLLEISNEEFQNIARLVYTRFGINLTDKKVTLVKGRLNKLLRSKGYSSFREYYDAVVKDPSGIELLQLVDKISTNHTYFYRENEHFSFMREQILPGMIHSGADDELNDLRIWCAGCSSGEEAYTLAIELQEFSKKFLRTINDKIILATDISLTALETAQRGEYPLDRVRGVPPQILQRYFVRTPENGYRIKNELRSLILYKRLNLMRESFPFKSRFHMIFCRNVMIYFDKPTKDRLVERFADMLVPGGYLFIGHSESLGRDLKTFQYIQPALYQRREF